MKSVYFKTDFFLPLSSKHTDNMAIIYNEVGSLTKVKNYLKNNKIDNFKSLGEIISFNKNYPVLRDRISDDCELNLLEEKKLLSTKIWETENILEKINEYFDKNFSEKLILDSQYILQLKSFTNKNFLGKILNSFKLNYAKLQTTIFQKKYYYLKKRETFATKSSLVHMQKRFSDLQFKFEKIHKRKVKESTEKIDFQRAVINEILSDVYGAIGEKKVENELQTLPDNFYIINDFCVSFSKAIYKKSTNEYIKSIQIDHLIIAPSGIFIIETKNWSKHSLSNPNLRSPIEQIQRLSFALFILLEKKRNSFMSYHRWGNKKIPIKNLLVFTQTKPTNEFQFIKILNHKEIVKYISYFPAVFTDNETKNIALYLNQL